MSDVAVLFLVTFQSYSGLPKKEKAKYYKYRLKVSAILQLTTNKNYLEINLVCMAEKRKASEDDLEDQDYAELLEESIQNVFAELERLLENLEESDGSFDEEVLSFLSEMDKKISNLIEKMES